MSLPFLDFPAEVRLAVYQYLIPNLSVSNFSLIRGRSKPGPLRGDGGRCCPAILRVNHQIYHEVVQEWYGSRSTPYEVVLDTKYILFCGRIIPPYVPLPSTIRWVHSMQLCISIQGTPQHTHSHATIEHLLGFQDRLTVLARLLSDRKTCRLQRLHIEVGVNIPLLLSLCKTPTVMLEFLGWNLGPIRTHVRDLQAVEWHLKEQSYGIQSAEFVQSYAELQWIMRGFLDDMRLEMLSSAM
ncbi:hypothetical protein FE257_002513 [Aspergillus nanangensis]|uniref:F-box domain-containing protein n=1 Tax=Aspergillus nanangensis TaxID=2582783 RepID=A0AAD4GWP1_ASPNN|nr:hypothetical protein FE257_002513 [Aspergillus nanangensis]